MPKFLSFSFALLFYVKIFAINSQNVFSDQLIQVEEFQRNLGEIKEQLEILTAPIQQPQQLQSDSCENAMKNANFMNGSYKLYLPNRGLIPFDVNCQSVDFEIFIIIQRRQDGSENFHRNWTDYKNGFGDFNGEFWLGLEKLHHLTKNNEYELRIWLKDELGKEGRARYKKFKVGDELEDYELTVGEFSGTVEDKLKHHNGKKFSTEDRDNDEWLEDSCANRYNNGWWFDACLDSNLNGDYNGIDAPYHYGIIWKDFGSKLTYTQMAIRRLIK